MRPRVIAYDVNETLLDLSALDEHFEAVLGDASLRAGWFQTMLQIAFVGVITGRHVDFTTAQHAALRMVARRAGRDLDDAGAERIVGGMRRLPPHPEVAGALERLRDAGFHQVTLSNSPPDVAREQIEHAGLAGVVDGVLSAEDAGQLKPGARAYGFAAERAGAGLDDLMLVAAHAWDVSGALAAGARAAFILRPGMVPSPIGEQPEIAAADLTAFAEQLCR